MAVFTPITPREAAQFLNAFEIGEVAALEGIHAGIENTNYFLTTQGAPASGAFVLTIFEKLTHAELPFYLEWMRALSDAGINVPRPIADRSGAILYTLKGKPCSIATRLPGVFIEHPTPAHCAEVGVALARMHAVGLAFMHARPTLMQPNPRGLAWWQSTEPVVAPHLPPALRALLHHEVHEQAAFAQTDAARALRRGPVHCDLFRNNVLFEGDGAAPHLGGFIDFYFGGVDTWMFDLAVTINDWCIDVPTGEIDAPRADAMMRAYGTVHAYTEHDRLAWPMMLRAAALRFWLSRLFDYYLPRDAHTLTPHDPTHFERILRLRRLKPLTLP